MNAKRKRTRTIKSEPSLFASADTVLRELLRRFGPPEPARRHFAAARVELLKGVRALVDARIAHISRPRARGERIDVQ
jgi:hypothetical protein